MHGEVRFDAFTRGLYATDASHYQIEPLGVVFPESAEDVESVLQVARAAGVPVLPRGGGTSQCGQTVGRAVVVDVSRHLTGVGPVVDGEIEVEPGVVLDQLNSGLASTHLWFPVDPATASRATLGGMAITFWHPAAISALSRRFPERRGFAISLHGTGGSIGAELPGMGGKVQVGIVGRDRTHVIVADVALPLRLDLSVRS